MDLEKIQYFEKIETSSHREFVANHGSCALCGQTLELKHLKLETDFKIKEEAHCVECDIKTRAKIYTLN